MSPHTRIATKRIGRLVDLHGITLSILSQLTGGAFLTGLILALHGGNIHVGLVASIPLVVTVSQVYFSWIIERQGHWKRSALQGAIVGRAPYVFVIVLLWVVTFSSDFAIWGLIVIVAIAAAGGAMYGSAFLSWTAEIVPLRERSEFWGKRSRISEPVGLGVALLASIVIDHVQRADRTSPALSKALPFTIIMSVAGAIGLLGILILRKVPSASELAPEEQQVAMTKAAVESERLSSTLKRPLKDRNFRPLLYFVAIWGFACGLAGPFFTVYMLKELHVTFLWVTIFSLVPSAMTAIIQAHWGRLADHFGNKPVLRMATLVVTVLPLIWMLTGQQTIWPIFVAQALSGFGWAAYHVTFNNLILKIAPERSRASFIAVAGAAFGGSQALGPLVGGAMLDLLAGVHPGFALWPDPAFPFVVVFGVSFIIRAAATPFLGFVYEPKGSTLGHMMRVMGRFRATDTESEAAGSLYGYVYTNMARVADFIARERVPVEQAPPFGGRRSAAG